MEPTPAVDLTPRAEGLQLSQPLAEFVEQLLRRDGTESSEALLGTLEDQASSSVEQDLAVYAATSILSDLHRIGWSFLVSQGADASPRIVGHRPDSTGGRGTRRDQLLAARAEALDDPGIRAFVGKLEAEKRRGHIRSSIFSLVADGRELRGRLERAGPGAIDAYVQLVEEGALCEYTGLLLSDVWRYFRLTWTNPPRSIPARQMRLLIRDRMAPNHAVIGIAELSGAAVKVSARDQFLGWDGQSLGEWWGECHPAEVLAWASGMIRTAVAEIHTADFVNDGILTQATLEQPDEASITCLRGIESFERTRHEYLPKLHLGKTGDVARLSLLELRERAETPLFRSKRAGRLASLLSLRRSVLSAMEAAGPEALQVLEATGAAKRLLRLAKSRTQGTAIADLTVCGAIAPYNHLAAGKLVAALAAGPSTVAAYRRRYAGSPSVIASSMAGRPIVRDANLVAISTTSLYGMRPSQYDRIAVPLSSGGTKGDLTYSYLGGGEGRTKGWGTFHVSARSVRAMEAWLQRRQDRRRVTYTYGEGASPRLRLLREGIKEMGWRPEDILIHGHTKSLYVCRLASNVRRYLIGMDAEPQYLFDLNGRAEEAEARISRWWLGRWALARAQRVEILERLSSETLAHPISHNARVRLPESPHGGQIGLFDAW
jgi:hypothetical protein